MDFSGAHRPALLGKALVVVNNSATVSMRHLVNVAVANIAAVTAMVRLKTKL